MARGSDILFFFKLITPEIQHLIVGENRPKQNLFNTVKCYQCRSKLSYLKKSLETSKESQNPYTEDEQTTQRPKEIMYYRGII